MIRRARIKLTILYSAIFLLLFWSLSFGIYFWMNQFYGDRSRLHEILPLQNETVPSPENRQEDIGDIMMDDLRNVLINIDLILLITIPAITWLLTGNTLEPVQKAYLREQQFLSDASHELRTPLSILRAEMEVALNRKRSVTEYQQVIKSNKEEVDDLSALVENLLFISRENTKYSSPINDDIDLTDLIAERVAYFQPKTKQKKLTLTLHSSKAPSVIKGNQHLIKRLFTNLLDNAIKFTEKGSITIAIKQTKNAVTVAVTDTGRGISKEHQEKIFDRFYRTDESRSEQGYGLGLSIAKQIMGVHHGSIIVKSELKKGTTMTLTFPLSDNV
jgi:two-component system, OmpR family, sensor histidine kinase CiaH